MKNRSSVQPGKVLVVDNDVNNTTFLAAFLQPQGFAIEHETHGNQATSRVVLMQPAAVVLELNLPGKDGLEVCREIRPGYTGPVIVLTTRNSEVDHILSLELGADDFLVKPVQPRILLVHLKAALRRAGIEPVPGSGSARRFGELRIDVLTRSVFLRDRELVMTTSEFDLLWLFATRAGEILSRNDIMTHLRGIGHDSVDRSIDMRVSRLRKLLDDDTGHPRRIKTVRGRGYLFSPTGWD